MKQPEALRLAEGNDECAKAWMESSDAHKFRKETAAELRRLHAVNQDLLVLHKNNMELMMEIAQELKKPRLPLATTAAASVRMLAIAAKESIDAIEKAGGAS